MSRNVESADDFVVARRAPRAEPRYGASVIVMGSGKGGVGTSALSVLLARVIAERDRRVLLVDGDEDIGTLGLMIGAHEDAPGLRSLRRGRRLPHQLVQTLRRSLAFVSGGAAHATADGAIDAGERRALYRQVSSLYRSFDIVIVEGGSRLEAVVAACGPGVDRVVAVTTPDGVAAAATNALIDALHARVGLVPVGLIVNRCADRAATAVSRSIRAGLRDALNGDTVALLGAVPDDPGLAEALEAGRLLTGPAPPAAAEHVGRIADRILEGPAAWPAAAPIPVQP